MDARLAALCASRRRRAPCAWATFGLALAVLPEPHWSALTPMRPLRRWRLVEVDEGTGARRGAPAHRRARAAFLAGVNDLDTRLQPAAAGHVRAASRSPAHNALAGRALVDCAGASARAIAAAAGPALAATTPMASATCGRMSQRALGLTALRDGRGRHARRGVRARGARHAVGARSGAARRPRCWSSCGDDAAVTPAARRFVERGHAASCSSRTREPLALERDGAAPTRRQARRDASSSGSGAAPAAARAPQARALDRASAPSSA